MSEFPRYVNAQLHCHSSIEGPASIGAHCYEAKRAGVEVVWLTDHDTRISLSIGGPFVDRFDFEAPELVTTVDRTATGGGTVRRSVGWHVLRQDAELACASAALTRERCFTGTQSLCLEAAGGDGDDEWRALAVEFKADSKIHSRPLLSDPTLGLAVLLDEIDGAPEDAEASLDLVLSEQPPDLRQARLRYRLTPGRGAPPDEESRYRTYVLPWEARPGEWVRREVRPAEDAARGDLGGADNAIVGLRLVLRVRRGAALRLFADDLTITHHHAGNALHARQRALAQELAARHGVVCHVAQEISQAGQHKNAWSSGVPLLDYPGQPAGFTHHHGVSWAKQHGSPFSLNHPFSAFNKLDIDDAMREELLARVLETYSSSGAWGATTLEVGFPASRHQFPIEYYFRLWDGLSRAGIYVAGSGSSDAHSARVGWQTGNNFATYIRADTTAEAALIDGLRAGDFYVADPVLFRSRLRFRDAQGHGMGERVPLAASLAQTEVALALDDARPEWRVHWVVDGERRSGIPLPAGPVRQTLDLPLDRPTFVRAEVWDGARTPAGEVAPDAGGRCIAFTNPIWYVGA